jgi:DNA topoisomerase IB
MQQFVFSLADIKKYENARSLKKHINKIRKSYTADLTSDQTLARQRATALYFIDKLALRVGNEKGEDEADTVGCCSLRIEHVKLEEPHWVEFDFLGKIIKLFVIFVVVLLFSFLFCCCKCSCYAILVLFLVFSFLIFLFFFFIS